MEGGVVCVKNVMKGGVAMGDGRVGVMDRLLSVSWGRGGGGLGVVSEFIWGSFGVRLGMGKYLGGGGGGVRLVVSGI